MHRYQESWLHPWCLTHVCLLPLLPQHSPFFAEQLTAFQVWLTMGVENRNPPEQLPIVLQVSAGAGVPLSLPRVSLSLPVHARGVPVCARAVPVSSYSCLGCPCPCLSLPLLGVSLPCKRCPCPSLPLLGVSVPCQRCPCPCHMSVSLLPPQPGPSGFWEQKYQGHLPDK